MRTFKEQEKEEVVEWIFGRLCWWGVDEASTELVHRHWEPIHDPHADMTDKKYDSRVPLHNTWLGP